MGYPYIIPRRNVRTDVYGMEIKAKPEESGFDRHYLYSDTVSMVKRRKRAKFNRLPYRQLG